MYRAKSCGSHWNKGSVWTAVMSTKQLDLQMVFTFPLTPVSLCLARVDGIMHTTKKSKLCQDIEKKIDSDAPMTVDVQMIDAMFII